MNSLNPAAPKTNLLHDLVLPTLLFAALGAMTWAVRGSSGYGGSAGCTFAGVMWGAAWWFIAREPGGVQSRRYSSGWIILALTIGIGLSGNRGWMQWSSFFEGRLQTDYSKGEFVPISSGYGFLWLFIAGMPWAGIGACLLAWCGSKQPTKYWHWGFRIGSGIAGAVVARYLFNHFPEVFLPLYSSITERYQDLEANPNLRRLMNDNRNAIDHLGVYLGFLSYEIGRRDWKNVVLILTVGVLNGAGWSICQNWKWAPNVWPGVNFNWWRCWESSGGISIGIAYGVAYFLVNRKVSEEEAAREGILLTNERPNLERFGAYLGLVLGLGLSITNGLKGWANIYLGNEDYWAAFFWNIIGPGMLILMVVVSALIWRNRLPRGYSGDVFPHAFWLIWTVLIVQNILAQLVTGPISVRNELAFNLYYLVLFVISGAIVCHDRAHKNRMLSAV